MHQNPKIPRASSSVIVGLDSMSLGVLISFPDESSLDSGDLCKLGVISLGALILLTVERSLEKVDILWMMVETQEVSLRDSHIT